MLSANLLPIENAEVVRVLINNVANTKFNFPTDENLKGKKIVSIEAFRYSDITASSMGEPVLNDNAFAKAFLTIKAGKEERIRELPLACLNAAKNNGLVKFFNDIVPDLQKSYISFSDTYDLVKGEVVFLVFYFR